MPYARDNKGKGEKENLWGNEGAVSGILFLTSRYGGNNNPLFFSSEDEEELPIEQIAFFVCGRTN